MMSLASSCDQIAGEVTCCGDGSRRILVAGEAKGGVSPSKRDAENAKEYGIGLRDHSQ